MSYHYAVDLGASNVRVAMGNHSPSVLVERRLLSILDEPRVRGEGAEAITEQIIKLCEEAREKAKVPEKKIITGGIGTPGLIQDGHIINSANFEYMNVNIREPLEEALGVKFLHDNDTNTAANGENYAGEAALKGFKNHFVVTWSSGIGGGAVIDGRVRRGYTGNFAEIGHMTVLDKGAECGCPKTTDCWEAYASGSGIAKRARKYLESHADTRSYILGYLTGDKHAQRISMNHLRAKGVKNLLDDDGNNKITGKMVFDAVKLRDRVASELCEDAIEATCIGLGNITSCFDPAMISFIGSIAKKAYAVTLRRVIERMGMVGKVGGYSIIPVVPIKLSRYPDKIGLYGALANAVEIANK